MQHLGKRLALAAAIAVALGLWSSSSLADSKEEAKKHFDNGTQMMELEDFGGAAAEFQTSLSLFRTSSALFNLAMCQKAQHRYPEALDSFRALLSEFGGKLTEDTRKEVSENIATLSRIMAEVEVVTNVSGASVHIDGMAAGTTPLAAPVRVGAGSRRISVSKAGYATAEKQVQIAAGGRELVRFELVAEASSASVATGAPSVAAPTGPAGYTQDNPDPEMIAVENALGKPMYRDYQRYQRGPASRKMGFVEYEYRVLKKKRTKGIVLACVLTPLFFAIGTTLNLVMQNLAAEQRADSDGDLYSTNDGDGAEIGSWVLFTLFAAAGTATLIPGVIHLAVGSSKLKKLKPVYKQYVEGVTPAAETPATETPPETPPETPAPETAPTATTARLQLHLAPVFDRHGTPAGAGLALVF
ncbi:MAG: PEGA domain-containing protein [Myxococcota bacterium]|jgi:hypothetical protein|nr:PEGA domain-containing protein [Myxococcota bacterium]